MYFMQRFLRFLFQYFHQFPQNANMIRHTCIHRRVAYNHSEFEFLI